MKFTLGTNKSKAAKEYEFCRYLQQWRRRFVLWPARLSVDGPKKTYVIFQWVYSCYPDARVGYVDGKLRVFLGKELCVEVLPSD